MWRFTPTLTPPLSRSSPGRRRDRVDANRLLAHWRELEEGSVEIRDAQSLAVGPFVHFGVSAREHEEGHRATLMLVFDEHQGAYRLGALFGVKEDSCG